MPEDAAAPAPAVEEQVAQDAAVPAAEVQVTQDAAAADKDADAATKEVVDGDVDYFYVCQKVLESVREKVKLGNEVGVEEVKDMVFPERLADTDMMVPVDMSKVGGDFNDCDEMIEKLGAKGTAEAFVKASDAFESTKDSIPQESRPQPMTAKDWKDLLEEQAENFFEGEEEEFLEGEEEEAAPGGVAAAVDAEGDGEPAAKKAKTDGDVAASS